jgi:hypothetical protein
MGPNQNSKLGHKFGGQVDSKESSRTSTGLIVSPPLDCLILMLRLAGIQHGCEFCRPN